MVAGHEQGQAGGRGHGGEDGSRGQGSEQEVQVVGEHRRSWGPRWCRQPFGVTMLVTTPVIRTAQNNAIARNAQPRTRRLNASAQPCGSALPRSRNGIAISASAMIPIPVIVPQMSGSRLNAMVTKRFMPCVQLIGKVGTTPSPPGPSF